MVKFVAYGWSSDRSLPALRDQVGAALAARPAHRLGRAARGAARVPRRRSGTRADVEVDGDPEVQQAVRFALFHVLQAGARAEQRPIAAKGLTGPGYDGHTLLGHRDVRAAGADLHRSRTRRADALRWRHSTLPTWPGSGPQQLGLQGAAFPWRTIHGEECSGVLAGRHRRVPHQRRHRRRRASATSTATGDDEFEREIGLELLVETARLWRSLGHHDRHGRFRIDGVTGPDEYSAVADNNVYTNLMAQRNLRAAADAVERAPGRGAPARRRRRGDGVLAGRRRGHAHPVRRASSACTRSREGFTRLRRSGTSTTHRPEQYPLLLHYPYFDLYRKQVVKQADLVLAMHCARRRVHRRAEGAQLRLLRARSPSATRRCRRAPRR